MGALARLQSSSPSNPVLDVYTLTNGVLTDIASLKYQIFDTTGASPVQVFPTTPGDKQVVDVATASPAGDKLGTGHYLARWTVPGNEAVGTHQIVWFIQLTLSVAEQTYTEDFEVLPEAVGSGYTNDYCLIADLRDEGVTVSMASDAFLAKRISLASRFIEAVTKRIFYAKSMVLKVDGKGGTKILLGHPIIAIEKVEFETSPFYPSSLQIDADLLRVYNRHLTQGLLDPDDRNNPKIELFHPSDSFVESQSFRPRWGRLIFPEGQQNVIVTGVFGYTDQDPDAINTQGKTPELITHVCKLIVMRELAKMAKGAARREAQNAYRLTSERTRDQAYTLEGIGSRKGAFFSGDPEIDNLLAYFQRPPGLGAA